MLAPTMEDDLGIVYLVDNAQQFWSELEDVLHITNDATLSHLDFALRRFLNLCAAYHEQYLQSSLQLGHACHLLLDSELFTFHSERMCDILVDDVKSNTNPHSQLILYNALLSYGRRDTKFFRSRDRWQELIPLLMDHVLVEIDPDTQDTYSGLGSSTINVGGFSVPVPVPIEAKLRTLAVRLLYEVCRVQKWTVNDLRIFDDSFLDYLFDLVEQTRNMHDETFNYSVIKLIVSLNEQFMVASLNSSPGNAPSPDQRGTMESKNCVLNVLMRRLGSSKTFGENMIFMLNRANRTAEDLCMQLLVLKILYLLFTTKGTSEYFYTNDLCVLVDVFLRELVDLDEDSESLRHTYLRVLYPLLTKTQLRSIPYKRPQIVMALESLLQNAGVRDINPTTKRLVERCLSGEWCVQFRTTKEKTQLDPVERIGSPGSDSTTSGTQTNDHLLASAEPSMSTALHLERTASIGKSRPLKTSKSMEFKKAKSQKPKQTLLSPAERLRYPNNASTLNLSGVASAVTPHSPSSPASPSRQRERACSADVNGNFGVPADRHQHHLHVYSDDYTDCPPPLSARSCPSPQNKASPSPSNSTHRRPPPTPPSGRRKPPPIPLGATNGGATMTAIKSSSPNPKSIGSKSPGLQTRFLSPLRSGC